MMSIIQVSTSLIVAILQAEVIVCVVKQFRGKRPREASVTPCVKLSPSRGVRRPLFGNDNGLRC